MKKLRDVVRCLALAFFFLLYGMPNQAQGGHFSCEGELLCVHPLLESTYFARAGNLANNQAERVFNDMGWQPAYRLTGLYAFNQGLNEVEIRGTFLKARHTKELSTQIASDYLSPTQGVPTPFFFTPATASSKISSCYWSLEALWGQILLDRSLFDLEIQCGVQYADLTFHEMISFNRLTSFGSTVVTNQDHFKGIGPEIALQFNYLLCHLPIYFIGDIRTTLFVGQSKSRFAQTLNEVPYFNGNNQSIWRLAPAIDLRLGFSLDWTFFCIHSLWEMGYEFFSITRAIHKVVYHDVVGSVDFSGSEDLYSPFCFHGPYLRLGIQF